jgi:hypothetical protein
VECVVLGVVLLVAIMAMTIGIFSGVRGSRWNEGLAHVARRFHGTFQSGGLFHTPCAWLRHGDAQARLTISPLRGGGGERTIQFTIQQRELDTRGEIFYYQNREALLPPKRGLLPVEFDWEDFRRRWQVLAEDGEALRRLLSDGVRLAIELLWRDPVPGEMHVSLSPGWLVIRKVWHSPRGVDLEAFVERACALSDQLNLAAASGIEFVAGDEPQLMEDARCGVCGEGLTHEIVVCQRCNTPHHRDCWRYAGGCATYGCGGRECFVPGVAKLAPPHFDEQRDLRSAKPR